MLISKNMKSFFIVTLFIIFSTVHTTNSMELCSDQNQQYTLFWHIVFVMRCSENNKCGSKYLRELTFDTIRKDKNFSFLHKPFQTKQPTCLINPQVHEYSLEMQHSLLKYNNNNYIEEARITCMGKASTDGILDNYSLSTDTTLLEQILVAMIKEHMTDSNYEKYVQKYPLYPSTGDISSSHKSLEAVIKQTLSCDEFETPRTKQHSLLLKKHFPELLIQKERATLPSKLLYSQLKQYEPEPLPCIALICPKDRHAKVTCETCNVVVHSQESDIF
jgi:hypothetical protein